MTTYSSILENAMDRGSMDYGLWSMWLQKVGHNLPTKQQQDLNKHFFMKYIEMAKRYEKMLNITKHQENGNQDYSETSTSHVMNACHQEDKR